MTNIKPASQDALVVARALADLVGANNVLSDSESLRFYSTDVYRQADALAAFVVRPGTVAELRAVARRPRGGGKSAFRASS